MKTPIPAPEPLQQSELVRGPRPPLLNLLILLEFLWTAVGYWPADTGETSLDYEAFQAMGTILSAIWFGVIYLLWRGLNWARWVVIIGSLFGALVIFTAPFETGRPQILAIAHGLLACMWLCFLLSRPAIAFTKGIPASP